MRGKRPRLVTIGDVTIDVVVQPVGAAESGTDVPASIRFRAGGSAANTARAFARMGGEATFVGAVGNDRMAGLLRAALRADGVNAQLTTTRGRTARLIVSLAPSGERSFLTDRGAAVSLSPRSMRPSLLTRADALHLPAYSLLNPPLSVTALEAARRAHAAGCMVSVDLASKRPLLAFGVAKAWSVIGEHHPDVLFANRDEAAALVGSGDLGTLLDLAPICVIKAGAAGCTVMWADNEMTVVPRPFKATDTTGAGDAFDAGFLYSLIATGRAPDSLFRLDLRHAAYDGQKAAAAFMRAPRAELDL